jgi:hypothetical protein
LQGDALEGKWVGGIEAERRLDSGDVFDFLDRCGCAADRDGGSVCVGAHAVATDLDNVAADFVSGVRKNFQDLRAVTEGVWR